VGSLELARIFGWHKVGEISLLAGKLFTAHEALCSVELAG
jgi:hypothetical protein